MCPDNPMISGLMRAYEMIEAREVMAMIVWRDMVQEYEYAARDEPTRMIATAGFRPKQMPMAEVFFDELSGREGTKLVIDIIRVLARSTRGKKILKHMARRHANFHWTDRLIDELEHPFAL